MRICSYTIAVRRIYTNISAFSLVVVLLTLSVHCVVDCFLGQ